ncbi:L-histidine N(alpha)-methyltransferase [Chryseosolibacter indicus]|uniref:L-histidine N(Alpha)-methyltransferase n=1 Tax=Chryseosolibacter indicus TaxID=2782351 RepID=A0ABS5VSP0_9BACT|nr:L-histidine N(alpha)-methyltransferase [Chryseosolibacter indicus]MBT1703822.1 L-histidine N(alpha)-methyltransferase [Chryseosolibacter indicus]
MGVQSYIIDADIVEAVNQGLSSTPKHLPSWLLYDAQGDQIFQSIMRMPEYYPTGCEYEILRNYRKHLSHYFTNAADSFELIELGPGDGVKTQLLLAYLLDQETNFTYIPIDVSENVLDLLKNRLSHALPKLQIQPHTGRYEEALLLFKENKNRKVILFLGANIGNYPINSARQFINKISKAMSPEDFLLVGFDLKKDPRVVQLAYDDPNGITKAFNLNLLARLNRELGANFSLDQFSHFPTYDPESATAKSFLVSRRKQDVYIDALNSTFHFEAWETIHTEVSQKYDLQMIDDMASKYNLEVADVFYDKNKYFADVLLRKRPA